MSNHFLSVFFAPSFFWFAMRNVALAVLAYLALWSSLAAADAEWKSLKVGGAIKDDHTLTKPRLAIILMTKNDMQMLPHWLAYHGHTFGFKNLFIVDGSTNCQSSYLQYAVNAYHFHLHTTRANLTHLEASLGRMIEEKIKPRFDWVIKMERDEFLEALTLNFSLPRHGAYGNCYGVRIDSALLPDVVADDASPLSATTAGTMPSGYMENYKFIWFTQSFKAALFNLGGHVAAQAECGVSEGSTIFHYHIRSHAGRKNAALQACIGYRYVDTEDSEEGMVQKLRAVEDKYCSCRKAYTVPCTIGSCHKVWELLDYLTTKTATTAHIFPKPTAIMNASPHPHRFRLRERHKPQTGQETGTAQ